MYKNTPTTLRESVNTALYHALDLAERGRAVFPMNPQTKRPACPHGVKDATQDPATIKAWFTRPGLVPAVATGAPSGEVVLDVDRQHNGQAWWRANRHRLPETEAYRTKSGGLHLVFQHAPGIRTLTIGAIGEGVEVRSTGASAIYWPGLGLPILASTPPAPMPLWLMPQKPAPEHRPWRADDEPRPPHHVEASLAGLVRNIALAGQGERNARLHWSACRAAEMSARGEIARRYAEAVLIEAAARCGLDHREAAATIGSAYRAGGR